VGGRNARRVGWIISVLATGPFLLSVFFKIRGGPELEQGFGHLGLPMEMRLPLAAIEVACVIVYLLPQTSVLGAILFTGLVGGTICTHWRVGDPFFIQILLGLFVWLGIFLREDRLRALLPIRTGLSRRP
jgi:hypothetical protein